MSSKVLSSDHLLLLLGVWQYCGHQAIVQQHPGCQLFLLHYFYISKKRLVTQKRCHGHQEMISMGPANEFIDATNVKLEIGKKEKKIEQ